MIVCVNTCTNVTLKSAASFSAKLTKEQLDLLQLQIQTASVDEETMTRYSNTLLQFTTWCNKYYCGTTAEAALQWCTFLHSERKLQPNTIDQYLSHLESFAELGMLDSPTVRSRQSKRFIKGLKKINTFHPLLMVMQPSAILYLYNLPKPTLIQCAILFQVFTGL